MAKHIGSLDPAKHSIVLNSNHNVVGVAEGDWFSLAYNSDLVTPTVGQKGDVTYSISANSSALLTINLLASSPSINAIRKMRHSELPITFVDNNTRDVITSGQCRLTKLPDKNASGSTSAVFFLPDSQEING